MAPLKENPYNFYKVLTFKWHVSKFEPNRIISLSEATTANFQNNGKICISCVDKALFSDGKNTVQAKQWPDNSYSDSTSLETTVKTWYADFKCSCTDMNNAECLDCPNLAVVLENTKKHNKLVLADQKLKLCKIAEELKISEGSVFTILHENLSMRKMCS